jgi:arsenite-transporting ATPase
MRVILVTGKGGVGKTTVAAATAIRAADLGHRTLVMSTDPAHSLADAYQVSLGDEPTRVVDGLDAQQIDAQQRLEESWGAVRDYLTDIFDWSGLKGIEAEELTVFPGMDELFSLASVRDHVESEKYDSIIVDCAPTAETLRLLSLPEVMSWYMEKMFPVGRKVAKVVRPVVSRVSSMPIADEQVFDSVARFYERIDGIRDILGDPPMSSLIRTSSGGERSRRPTSNRSRKDSPTSTSGNCVSSVRRWWAPTGSGWSARNSSVRPTQRIDSRKVAPSGSRTTGRTSC